MIFSGKTISILGDSISTYEGYTLSPGVFYDRFIQKVSGVKSVEDTWWMQVIRSLDARLGINDSFSGSTVYGNLSISAGSENRLKSLGKNGIPDVILVYMGTNDWGSYVMPDDFRTSYLRMLKRMKELYPEAEVYLATLLRGMSPEDGAPDFMDVDGCLSQNIYTDVIKQCAREYQMNVVDLAKYGVEYETIDGVHPDVRGMKTIAGLWKKELACLPI